MYLFARELVLDVLTTCTRPDTVPLIVRLVKQRKISDVRGSYMMMQISMLGTSSPKLASDLIVSFSRCSLAGQTDWDQDTKPHGGEVGEDDTSDENGRASLAGSTFGYICALGSM